jgi:hypothetical protein
MIGTGYVTNYQTDRSRVGWQNKQTFKKSRPAMGQT